ncbi:MAG TPA: chemotaxis protein CheW [Gemmatimonadaceae bacterium]
MFRDGIARLLVFRLGAERFAIDLAAVDEVIDSPLAQRLPDSPPHVLGLATIRGELIAIYDPRPVLHVGDTLDGAVLLFARGDRRVAIAIDDVFDAITVEPSDIQPAPGSSGSDGVLLGVVRRDGALIAVLDAEPLLDATMSVTEGERS